MKTSLLALLRTIGSITKTTSPFRRGAVYCVNASRISIQIHVFKKKGEK